MIVDCCLKRIIEPNGDKIYKLKHYLEWEKESPLSSRLPVMHNNNDIIMRRTVIINITTTYNLAQSAEP